jgi:hypothetical protein
MSTAPGANIRQEKRGELKKEVNHAKTERGTQKTQIEIQKNRMDKIPYICSYSTAGIEISVRVPNGI